MSEIALTTVEIEPQGKATAAIIWMHGLGANAHDFEPIVPHLQIPPELGLRFVFPNAPQRPVTINGGYVMPAWYDILSMSIDRSEDATGIRESELAIQALIQREQARGIANERILLAGFSQGGAIALHTGLRYPESLGGILALSCYVPLAQTLPEERHAANQSVPIFMAHGQFDDVVPLSLGQRSAELLRQQGYQPEWHEYPMRHEVNMDEISAIGAWLRRILSASNLPNNNP
jgi:phospholipase/carboxylesterase